MPRVRTNTVYTRVQRISMMFTISHTAADHTWAAGCRSSAKASRASWLVCFLTLFCPFTTSAQSVSVHHQQNVTPVVDGALNPELISDQEAITVFFRMVATQQNSSPESMALLSAKLKRISLNDDDKSKVVAAGKKFYVEVDPSVQAIAAINQRMDSSVQVAGDGQKRIALVLGITTLATQHYASLLSNLSPDGQRKLMDHISYMKTRMKVIPAPKM